MTVRADPEGGYVAEGRELPNCLGAGDTPEAALAELRGNMAAWLLAAVEHGRSIPEAEAERAPAYSGRFLLRVPKHLHRDLAELANREGVSLNSLAVGLLERGIGAVRASEESGGRTPRRVTP
jgi:antitoxin HicB